MKTRDSGMPDPDWWESFFDPDAVLDALGLHQFDGPVVDVGCGYGTFTMAAARRTSPARPKPSSRLAAVDSAPAVRYCVGNAMPPCTRRRLNAGAWPRRGGRADWRPNDCRHGWTLRWLTAICDTIDWKRQVLHLGADAGKTLVDGPDLVWQSG
jgi:hypothetical protein